MQTDEHPVVVVSWNDVQAFIAWLSRKEGKAYRLPTEAEWEYACRSGTTTHYASGDEREGLASVGNTADATAKEKFPAMNWTLASPDGYAYTAPAGRFRPNAFGLFDMHGNVWEQCSDGYSADYYKQSPVNDPSGAVGASYRVMRGGSWDCWSGHCRSAIRVRCGPDSRGISLGFRLARDPSAGAPDGSGGPHTSAPVVPTQRLAQGPPVPTAGGAGSPPVGKPTASSTDALQPGTSWRGSTTVVFASWTNDVGKPRPLWLTIKARKVTHFKAVADSPGTSREVEGTFKHGVIHWKGPNANSSWEGKLIGNQLVGTFKATNWQGDSSGKFRLTLADGLPPAVSPARVPPVGPARGALWVMGASWTVVGDQLIKEGVETDQVSFGDNDWTDYSSPSTTSSAKMATSLSNAGTPTGASATST